MPEHIPFSFEDVPARGGIRFAVGSPTGRRSSTWRLWGDKKGDVYLSMRSQGARMKASYHRDRRCSVGFTREYEITARTRFNVPSRHWERWTLPSSEVVRIAEIVFPESELETFTTVDAAQMRWLPTPKPGNAIIVSIYIAEPPEACNWENTNQDGHLIGIMHTSTRFTWAVFTEKRLDDQSIKHFDDARAKALRTPIDKEVTSSSGLRMTLWGYRNSPADMYFVELAVRNQTNLDPQ